jgi:hypothetical protein
MAWPCLLLRIHSRRTARGGNARRFLSYVDLSGRAVPRRSACAVFRFADGNRQRHPMTPGATPPRGSTGGGAMRGHNRDAAAGPGRRPRRRTGHPLDSATTTVWEFT